MESLQGTTIVFDLDGTLVDTAPDLLRVLRVVLDAEGLTAPPEEGMRRMVGQGARALLARAAAECGVSFEPDRLTVLTERFIDIYRDSIAELSRPFPHVEEALDALVEAGAALSVCSNKRTELSERLLDALDMRRRFDAVVGADAVPERKPSPMHYRAAVAAARGDISRSVMVGDSAADVSAAKSAGAPCIVVRFGYCDGDVDALGADAFIDSYKDLRHAVMDILARTSTGP